MSVSRIMRQRRHHFNRQQYRLLLPVTTTLVIPIAHVRLI